MARRYSIRTFMFHDGKRKPRYPKGVGNCYLAPTCYSKKTSRGYYGWSTFTFSLEGREDCDARATTSRSRRTGSIRHCKEPALGKDGKPIYVQSGIPICRTCHEAC